MTEAKVDLHGFRVITSSDCPENTVYIITNEILEKIYKDYFRGVAD